MDKDIFKIYQVTWNPDTNKVEEVTLVHKKSGEKTTLSIPSKEKKG